MVPRLSFIISGIAPTLVDITGSPNLNDSKNNVAATPVSTGLRYTDFTLTQEQIDSIQSVYVYGPGPDYQNNLFTFIRIVKISQ